MRLHDLGTVGLVGAGKMGLAMVRGWLAAGLEPASLVLVDPFAGAEAQALAQDHGVALEKELPAGFSGTLVLAVKPQVVAEVMEGLRGRFDSRSLVISVVAGTGVAALSAGLGTDNVVRTIPNTPAQVGKGVTGVFVGPGAAAGAREVAEALLTPSGKVVWLNEESGIDAVTALSGSGPAYVFHLVEAMAAAGEAVGLAPDMAMVLARQTVIGAAALMEEDPASAAQLRTNVTSPNGTTAAALDVLMGAEGLEPLMQRAIRAAHARCIALGREEG